MTATTLPCVLRAAAAHLDLVGLSKNGFTGDYAYPGQPVSELSVDVVGALAYAACGDPLYAGGSPLVDEAVRLIAAQLPGDAADPAAHVAAWGDADGRTAAQVAGLLRLCAAMATVDHPTLAGAS
jgi:hypothetical protein